MDRWIDGWINGAMDRWMDRWIDSPQNLYNQYMTWVCPEQWGNSGCPRFYSHGGHKRKPVTPGEVGELQVHPGTSRMLVTGSH